MPGLAEGQEWVPRLEFAVVSGMHSLGQPSNSETLEAWLARVMLQMRCGEVSLLWLPVPRKDFCSLLDCWG